MKILTILKNGSLVMPKIRKMAVFRARSLTMLMKYLFQQGRLPQKQNMLKGQNAAVPMCRPSAWTDPSYKPPTKAWGSSATIAADFGIAIAKPQAIAIGQRLLEQNGSHREHLSDAMNTQRAGPLNRCDHIGPGDRAGNIFYGRSGSGSQLLPGHRYVRGPIATERQRTRDTEEQARPDKNLRINSKHWFYKKRITNEGQK